jgi:ELWxxDGT repeat protein
VLGLAAVLASCPVPFSLLDARSGSAPLGSLSIVHDLWRDGDSEPYDLTAFGDLLVFGAYDAATGRELYAYDGTAIRLLADIEPGSAGSNPEGFIEYDGKLYFSAKTAGAGRELWRFDGTDVEMVHDLNPGPPDGMSFLDAAVFGFSLVFRGSTATHSYELFSYYRTWSEPRLLEDINPVGPSFPRHFTVLGDVLYFQAETDPHGIELFQLRGISMNVEVAASRPDPYDLRPSDLTVYRGRLYFVADGEPNELIVDNQLFVYDPSAAGPPDSRATSVAQIATGSTNDSVNEPYVFDGELFFHAYNGSDYLLHRYDGAAITAITSSGTDPRAFMEFDGKLFYSAYTASAGRELWVYELGHATMVDDARPGPGSSFPAQLTVFKNQLYLSASVGHVQGELFRLSRGI